MGKDTGLDCFFFTSLLRCLELQTGVAAVVEAVQQKQHWRARILFRQNQIQLFDGYLFTV